MTDKCAGLPVRRQQLIVFFSADLVNATDYKTRHPPGTEPTAWPGKFERIFQSFHDEFLHQIQTKRSELEQPRQATCNFSMPKLWKINGDELLYRDFVYPGEENEGFPSFVTSVKAFIDTVSLLDSNLLEEDLGIKGCVWTAGFPIRNKQISFRAETASPVIQGNSDIVDPDAGDPNKSIMKDIIDYLGVDIDLGFRLCSNTPPGRVRCSLDVAWFLTFDQNRKMTNVFHLGWTRLKGVCGGNPYPLLLLSQEGSLKPRTPWEPSDDNTLAELRNALSNSLRPLSVQDVRDLAEELWKTLKLYLIKPYASFSRMHPAHTPIWTDKHEIKTLKVKNED
ncbi:MAG: hypothetical protein ABR909_09700 [Candidatus Bathyarchaeia archaeon]